MTMHSNPAPIDASHAARAPILTTPRLILRLWRDADIAPFVALNADARVTEFLPGPVTPGQAKDFVEKQNALYALHGTCYFAAELEATGELAGFVGVKYQDFAAPFAPCFEIGWRLGAPHWGRGLASEGAQAVLDYAFDTLGLREIVAFTVPPNLRSVRVMERLGMVRVAGADFAHPALPSAHPLSWHLLYRITSADRQGPFKACAQALRSM